MQKQTRKSRTLTIAAVSVVGLALAAAFLWGRPFDAYLLHRWEAELATLPDGEVPARLEQLTSLGDRSVPTLVRAVHSERQAVADNASRLLQREFSAWEMRSNEDTSRLVALVAAEMAEHAADPGPYSGTGAAWLATRILLWPIDRELVDGERLVADCELILRSAKRTSPRIVNEEADGVAGWQDALIAESKAPDPAELVSSVAGGGLPAQLTDPPLLPPQETQISNQLHAVAIAEPNYLVPAQTASVFDARPMITATDDASSQAITRPPAVDPRQSLELRRDDPVAPRAVTVRPDLKSMSDLDVMRQLAGSDDAIVREAVDELYNRGFQTKHFRLAELLVDPDTGVRLQLVQSLPQMAGIDSRPWLLWLSRDQDPAVRKAAVAVIATSSDPALQKRVRELEQEETDEEVLQTVRQILSSRQLNSRR